MPSTKIINVSKDDKFEELLDLFKKASAQEVIFILPNKGKALQKEDHFETLSKEGQKLGKTVSVLASSPSINQLAAKYNFSVLSPHGSDAPKAKPKPKVKTAVSMAPSYKNIAADDEQNILDEEEAEQDAIGIKLQEDEYVSEKNTDPEEVEEEKKLPIQESAEEPNEEDLTEIETENEAEGIDETENSFEKDFEIVTAAARRPTGRKTMEGIIHEKGEHSSEVEIKEKIGKYSIPIKKEKRPSMPANLEEIENVWQKGVENESIWEEEKPRKKKNYAWPILSGRKPSKKIWLSGAGIILVAGILFVALPGSAKVTIKPVEQQLNIQLKVTASDKYSDVNLTFSRIPGQTFTVEKTASESFNATGEKDAIQKARGKITIYNSLNTPQPLIATTRFQSPEGLIFRSLETVTVPKAGAQPGQVSVEIIADKAGQEYNIGPSKFTIIAFKEKGDTEKYEKIYGQSSDSMRGGIVGKANVVTEADYNNAKSITSQKVTQAVQDELKSQTVSFTILNSASVSLELSDTAKPDDAVDNFTFRAKGFIKTVGFKRADLDKLIKDYVEKTNNLVVLLDRLEIAFDKVVFQSSDDTLTFTVIIKGPGFSKIDQSKIISELINKNEVDIKSYLGGSPGVASAKVSLSPFWISKVPSDSRKINIKIEY